LKPPIDTLPQTAQERAMVVLGSVITGTLGLEGRERSGMIAPPLSEPPTPDANPSPEVDYRVPTASTPGRSLVSRRAVVDIVRTATLGSYGVTGFAGGGPLGRLVERLGLGQPGIEVTIDDTSTDRGLAIELDLTVAYGVPVAEVARQVDSAVRYALRRALETDVERLTIHVDGLRFQPGDLPAVSARADPSSVGPDDLAASGTDVA
jgi:uncharacterized alkaline shock family protein YloU